MEHFLFILQCLFRPSGKFAIFRGSRKPSFTYTGMFGEDEEEDYPEQGMQQFVINDNEVCLDSTKVGSNNIQNEHECSESTYLV